MVVRGGGRGDPDRRRRAPPIGAAGGMDPHIEEFSRELLRFRVRRQRNWFYCTTFMDALLASARQFSYEGISAFVADRPAAGLVPLWRMRSRETGRYFLTAREDERDLLGRERRFTRGTIVAHVSPVPRAGLVPMYRLRREGTDDHFWTCSEAERSNALTAHGFEFDEVAFFVRSI